jgi:DNA invertase Pin-like site-specific DNA recombinase
MAGVQVPGHDACGASGSLRGSRGEGAGGGYKGRSKSIDAAEIKRLLADRIGPTNVAKRLGIGRASVYRLASQ